ncbi:hypothetical protein A1F94_007921 [Pyrenophora tritici-repentis]|nr:hypothetical protein A1F94_007921 [Pyrenophora tritici-repentis]
MDSGTTIHVGNDLGRFTNIRPPMTGDFLWAGNTRVWIKAYGSVTLRVDSADGHRLLYLENVAYCPDLHCSLVSFRILRRQGLWWDTKSDPTILRRSDDSELAVLHEKYGQWILELNDAEARAATTEEIAAWIRTIELPPGPNPTREELGTFYEDETIARAPENGRLEDDDTGGYGLQSEETAYGKQGLDTSYGEHGVQTGAQREHGLSAGVPREQCDAGGYGLQSEETAYGKQGLDTSYGKQGLASGILHPEHRMLKEPWAAAFMAGTKAGNVQNLAGERLDKAKLEHLSPHRTPRGWNNYDDDAKIYIPDRHQNNAPQQRDLNLSQDNIITGRRRRQAHYIEAAPNLSKDDAETRRSSAGYVFILYGMPID